MTASRYSNCSAAEVMEMPRSRSMSIQSDTVPRRPALPCTAPACPITRACRARASVRVDLPASGWLMTAKVRRGPACRTTSLAVVPDVAVPGAGVSTEAAALTGSTVTGPRRSPGRRAEPPVGAMAPGAFPGAVAVVAPDPLHHLEEDPGTEHLGEQLQVAAVGVLVVEQPALAHRGQQIGVEAAPRGQVVVVVARDWEQRRTRLTQRPCGGDQVVGREGDVLGGGHAGSPLAAAQQRDAE